MQQKVQGLNKEFEKRDVERMRNLIQGKANTSSESQVGYTKKRIERKEGDVWTENKKTWTIKNGIKQTISKLDAIKKEVFVPLCCPKCNPVEFPAPSLTVLDDTPSPAFALSKCNKSLYVAAIVLFVKDIYFFLFIHHKLSYFFEFSNPSFSSVNFCRASIAPKHRK